MSHTQSPFHPTSITIWDIYKPQSQSRIYPLNLSKILVSKIEPLTTFYLIQPDFKSFLFTVFHILLRFLVVFSREHTHIPQSLEVRKQSHKPFQVPIRWLALGQLGMKQSLFSKAFTFQVFAAFHFSICFCLLWLSYGKRALLEKNAMM